MQHQHMRRGVKSNKHPRGREGSAPFNTEADGARAIRRAKRWLARYGNAAIPPRHIYENADVAGHQFGDELLKTRV